MFEGWPKFTLPLSISIVDMLGWCKGVSNHRSVGSMIPFSASGSGSIPRVGEVFCELEVGQPKKIPKSQKIPLTSLVYRSTWHWRSWPRSWVVFCQGKAACYEQHRDNEWQRHLTSRTPKGNVGLGLGEVKGWGPRCELGIFQIEVIELSILGEAMQCECIYSTDF